ncbi:MAG: DnaJ domain-containing protein [Clostridia bacterium]|nr:DnaJ domain-containing protein [Clostridia bacterium]
MDAYAVLGVNRGSTIEEIKQAYRELSRKYQQESLDGSPLSDVARRKMQELDMAYDDIMSELNIGFNQGNANSYASSQGDYGSSQYYDVRQQIQNGRVDDAETILDGIPSSMRNAEWYYLKGQIHQKRGWFDEAYSNYSKACQMEPSNTEYSNAFNALNRNATGGYRQNYGSSSSSCGACDICSGLICADCCCECMGGDLISCC